MLLRPVTHFSVTSHQLMLKHTCTTMFAVTYWTYFPLFLGAGIHGNDDPTDDNSSADAADPLSASAPSFTPTATSPYAATGNTHTHTPTQSPRTELKTIFVNVWAVQT